MDKNPKTVVVYIVFDANLRRSVIHLDALRRVGGSIYREFANKLLAKSRK